MNEYIKELIPKAKEILDIDDYLDIVIKDFGSFTLKFRGADYLRDLKAEILDMLMSDECIKDELEVYIMHNALGK